MSLSDAVRELPPLIALLEIRTRSSEHGAKSKDRGIPIDADAIDLWGDVRDQIREWAEEAHSLFDADNLTQSFQAWVEAFTAMVVPDTKLLEVTRQCEYLVRRIRNKYDPPQLAEWKSPCPKCQTVTRHLNRAGVTVATFADSITVDVTNKVAECSVCGETFTGSKGLALLRLLTNVDEQLTRGETVDKGALAIYLEYRGVSDVA